MQNLPVAQSLHAASSWTSQYVVPPLQHWYHVAGPLILPLQVVGPSWQVARTLGVVANSTMSSCSHNGTRGGSDDARKLYWCPGFVLEQPP